MSTGDYPDQDPFPGKIIEGVPLRPVKADVYDGLYLAKEHVDQLDRIEKMLKELIEAAKNSRLAP